MQWENGSPEMGPVFSDQWAKKFGPTRKSDEPLDAKHNNFARSLQAMAEVVYFHTLNYFAESNPTPNLCLAGGCAYNSVANGKIFEQTPFKELHIHPAAGDAGTAVGAAYWIWHQELGKRSDLLQSLPEFREYRCCSIRLRKDGRRSQRVDKMPLLDHWHRKARRPWVEDL